jgi:hypothetical protein
MFLPISFKINSGWNSQISFHNLLMDYIKFENYYSSRDGRIQPCVIP